MVYHGYESYHMIHTVWISKFERVASHSYVGCLLGIVTDKISETNQPPSSEGFHGSQG